MPPPSKPMMDVYGGQHVGDARSLPNLNLPFWAVIEAADGYGHYAWREVLAGPATSFGGTPDQSNPLRFGSLTTNTAYEINSVPLVIGRIVKLRRAEPSPDPLSPFASFAYVADVGGAAEPSPPTSGNPMILVLSDVPDSDGLLDGLVQGFDCEALEPVAEVACKVYDPNNPRLPDLAIGFYTGVVFLCVRNGLPVYAVTCCPTSRPVPSSSSSSGGCPRLSTVYDFVPSLYTVDLCELMGSVGVVTLSARLLDVWQWWSVDGSTFVSLSVAGDGSWLLSIFTGGTDYVFTGPGVCTAVYEVGAVGDSTSPFILTLTGQSGSCTWLGTAEVDPASPSDNCVYPAPDSVDCSGGSSSSGSTSPFVPRTCDPISAYCDPAVAAYSFDLGWVGLGTRYLVFVGTPDRWIFYTTDLSTRALLTFNGSTWELGVETPGGDSIYVGITAGCCAVQTLSRFQTTDADAPASLTLTPYSRCTNCLEPPPPQPVSCPPLLVTGPAPYWFSLDLTGSDFFGNMFGTVCLEFRGTQASFGGGSGTTWGYGEVFGSTGLGVEVTFLAGGNGSITGVVWWKIGPTEYCEYLISAVLPPPFDACAPITLNVTFVQGSSCAMPGHLTMRAASPCDNCPYDDPCAAQSGSSGSEGRIDVCGAPGGLPTTIFGTLSDNVACNCATGTIPLVWDSTAWVGTGPFGSCGRDVTLRVHCEGTTAADLLLDISFSDLGPFVADRPPVASGYSPLVNTYVNPTAQGPCNTAVPGATFVVTVTES